MEQTLTAIYANGVLRPLTPLALPEHPAVEMSLKPLPSPAAAATHRRRVRQGFSAAGLVLPEPDTPPRVPPLSAAERHALAGRLSTGRPLSEIIIEECEGR